MGDGRVDSPFEGAGGDGGPMGRSRGAQQALLAAAST